jgi:glutaryl-CoA dehydrogenase
VGEPAILPFDWADPFDLNHQLNDEERRTLCNIFIIGH